MKLKKTLFNLLTSSMLILGTITPAIVMTSCATNSEEQYLNLSTINNETSFIQSKNDNQTIQLVIDTSFEFDTKQFDLQWTNDQGDTVNQPTQIEFDETNLTLTFKSVNNSSKLDGNYHCHISLTLFNGDQELSTALDLIFKYVQQPDPETPEVNILVNGGTNTEFTNSTNQTITLSLQPLGGIVIDESSINWQCHIYNTNTDQLIDDEVFDQEGNPNPLYVQDGFEISSLTSHSPTFDFNIVSNSDSSIMVNNYRFNFSVSCHANSDETPITKTIDINLNNVGNSWFEFEKFEIHNAYQSDEDQVVADIKIKEIIQPQMINDNFIVFYFYLNKNNYNFFEIQLSSIPNGFAVGTQDFRVVPGSGGNINDLVGLEIKLILKGSSGVKVDKEYTNAIECSIFDNDYNSSEIKFKEFKVFPQQ